MPGRPWIVIVDDRPHGLSALTGAVERRFGADYVIVPQLSAGAALDELSRARRDGEDVALVIADQWMPEMSGRELLRRAHELHPEAQRALLVGWGDRRASETILQGCALGELDNYLRAVSLRADGERRIIVLDDGKQLAARAIVNATGAEYRRLTAPRIARFDGLGVLYTAGADVASALRGKELVVYGGGNSAGQAVVHLAKRAQRVVHVVRGHALAESMSAYLADEIARLPNVELRFDTEVVDAEGERSLQRVVLRHRRTGMVDVIATPALFVMIGALPRIDWLRDTLEHDPAGFLLTGTDLAGRERARPPMLLETSMPGVFAVGDVRHGSTKRIASAVGEAAVAIHVVHEYLALSDRRVA